MKSPFPGMDPYLEEYWGDVHTSFLIYARNQLNAQLPDDLQARVEESVTVTAEEDEGEQTRHTRYPDVQVSEQPGRPSGAVATATVEVAVAEPYVLLIDDEPRTERHLEIVDSKKGGRVVTVLELLSPANKVGLDGPVAYVRKQKEYLDAGVNLVEVDLVHQGDFVLAAPEERIPARIRTPYMVCIRRAAWPSRAELYPIRLTSPLPNIPIPLRQTDRDVVLQIQPLVDECYRDGRYHTIDYRKEPVTRLSEEESQWMALLLREKGLR